MIFFDTAFSASVKTLYKTDGQLIKSIRIGAHRNPLKTRVVVDLKTDREYDFEVKQQEQEKILVVTLFFQDDRLKSEGQPVTDDSVEEVPKPVAQLQVKESVQQEIDLPPAGEKNIDKQVRAPETGAKSPKADVKFPEKAVKIPETGEKLSTTDILPADKQNAIIVEEKEENEPRELQSSPEPGKEITSLPAEERVNQIIANIKDPKPAAADPILLDVSYESTANDSEMVLFKLNDFYPPIVFGIEKGNPRVVCDFLDTMLASDVPPVIQTNGVFVRKIRTARHPSPEKVRVVLDLVPNKNYDLQQVFFKEDNLFVIIISEFEKESVKPLKTVPESVRGK